MELEAGDSIALVVPSGVARDDMPPHPLVTDEGMGHDLDVFDGNVPSEFVHHVVLGNNLTPESNLTIGSGDSCIAQVGRGFRRRARIAYFPMARGAVAGVSGE